MNRIRVPAVLLLLAALLVACGDNDDAGGGNTAGLEKQRIKGGHLMAVLVLPGSPITSIKDLAGHTPSPCTCSTTSRPSR